MGVFDWLKLGIGAFVGACIGYHVGIWTGTNAGYDKRVAEEAVATAKADAERRGDDAKLQGMSDYDLCVAGLRSGGVRDFEPCETLRAVGSDSPDTCRHGRADTGGSSGLRKSDRERSKRRKIEVLVNDMEQPMPENMDALLRRMDGMERNSSDISRMITEIVANSAAMGARVKTLEDIQQDRRVADVERAAREHAMQKDIASIQTDVTTIKTGINRVLWAVALAVVTTFVGFVLRGGLHG